MKNFEVTKLASKRTFTINEFFAAVIDEAERLGVLNRRAYGTTVPAFDNKLTIDYVSHGGEKVYEKLSITCDEFDFRLVPNYGGSEGIYIDCYITGYPFKDRKVQKTIFKAGTLKTLETSDQAARYCGELSGILLAIADRYRSVNIDCFEL